MGMLICRSRNETHAIPGMRSRKTNVSAQRTWRAEAEVFRVRKLEAKATTRRRVHLAAMSPAREKYPSGLIIPGLLCFSLRR
jgi:hypothetical protein